MKSYGAKVSGVPKPENMDHKAVVWGEHLGDVEIVRVHSSGAHMTATVDEVVRYTKLLIEAHRPAVLTTTESTQKGLVRAMRKELGPRYLVRKAGEYLCILDSVHAAFRPWPSHRRRMTRIKGLNDDWRNLFIGDFRIRFQRAPGLRYCAAVGHVASGVQDGDRYRRDRLAMVLANHEGMINWGKWMDKRDGLIISASGDFNLDFRRQVWRNEVERCMGGTLIWGSDAHEGSHYNRLIDGAVLRMGGVR